MKASYIAKQLGARLLGDDVEVFSINKLSEANRSELSLIAWPKDLKLAKKSAAGVLICTIETAADHADQLHAPLIVVEDLYPVFLSVPFWFKSDRPYGSEDSISSSAQIAESAVIEAGARIGKYCRIGPGAIIFKDVYLGDEVVVGANSVVGCDAFVPFGADPTRSLPSLGTVVIEQGSRIGALCTIDRGLLGQTRIGADSLLDNQVHVGHDVDIGKNVVVAAQSGFAGFVRLGDSVTCGGQVGVGPHITIGDGARISGKSAVHCDIKKHQIWSGNPSVPHAIYLRAYGKIMNQFRAKRNE